MNDKTNFGMGIRLSGDGTALALDWNQDGKVVTTFLPSVAVPEVLHMLLDAAAKAGERLEQPPVHAAKPASVFQATGMQLLTIDSGTNWILRIDVGSVRLDFALTKQLVQSLQRALTAPAPKR